MTSKEMIAKRVAMEFEDGDLVNLGVGLPELCAKFIPEGKTVFLHAENGIIGVCPQPEDEEPQKYRFDAGETFCGILPEGCTIDSATSFGIVRGGHLAATVLGTMQVDEEGSIANWTVPGGKLAGMGGAMDLVVGARKVIVATVHCSKDGKSKILKKCTFPLTGYKLVNKIVTELCVIDVTPEGLVLREVAPGVTPEEVQAKTEAHLIIPDDVKEMKI